MGAWGPDPASAGEELGLVEGWVLSGPGPPVRSALPLLWARTVRAPSTNWISEGFFLIFLFAIKEYP